MTLFWWVVVALLALSCGASAAAFGAYVWVGEDRYNELAKACARWVVVVALGAFNIAIFKHIVVTLASF
jgi:hypothetical protein